MYAAILPETGLGTFISAIGRGAVVGGQPQLHGFKLRKKERQCNKRRATDRTICVASLVMTFSDYVRTHCHRSDAQCSMKRILEAYRPQRSLADDVSTRNFEDGRFFHFPTSHGTKRDNNQVREEGEEEDGRLTVTLERLHGMAKWFEMARTWSVPLSDGV